jgi:hypothetical protein
LIEGNVAGCCFLVPKMNAGAAFLAAALGIKQKTSLKIH